MLDPWADWLRRVTAARLGDHFAQGELSTQTFELRLGAALGAESHRQSRELLWDLAPAIWRTRIDGVETPVGHLESADERARWVLGRSRSCDQSIDSQFVSARHVQIVRRGATWTIEDLGSTNGTWLNGHPITRARLLPGDEIVLGTNQATLHVTGELPWWRAAMRRIGVGANPASALRLHDK